MSQSCCAGTFAFPLGKKKACQSPECNQEALCCNGCYASDFPRLSVHIHRANEKEKQKKLPESSHLQSM